MRSKLTSAPCRGVLAPRHFPRSNVQPRALQNIALTPVPTGATLLEEHWEYLVLNTRQKAALEESDIISCSNLFLKMRLILILFMDQNA